MPSWLKKVGKFMKWLMAAVLSGSVLVMSCSTVADSDLGGELLGQAAGAFGYTKQQVPLDGETMCAAARRVESAAIVLETETEKLGPFVDCVVAEAQVLKLAGDMAAMGQLHEAAMAEVVERLNRAQEILYAIVNAEGIEVLTAVQEAEAYLAEFERMVDDAGAVPAENP